MDVQITDVITVCLVLHEYVSLGSKIRHYRILMVSILSEYKCLIFWEWVIMALVVDKDPNDKNAWKMVSQ